MLSQALTLFLNCIAICAVFVTVFALRMWIRSKRKPESTWDIEPKTLNGFHSLYRVIVSLNNDAEDAEDFRRCLGMIEWMSITYPEEAFKGAIERLHEVVQNNRTKHRIETLQKVELQ